MRALLFLLCLFGLAALAWYAVAVGTGQSKLLGAPQIEELVDRTSRAAIADISERDITVETDGRNVHLSGRVSSDEERAEILSAVGGVRLLGRLSDDLDVLAAADPFTFKASKTADGALRLEGFVPDRDAEDRLLAEARVIAAGAPVTARLTRAIGAPEGDWTGMASAGLAALSNLTRGSAEIIDLDGVLVGESESEGALDAASAALDLSPVGTWVNKSRGSAPDEGYLFTALKAPDGGVVLRGYAPDETVRDALVAHAAGLSDIPIDAELSVADGMPDPSWPDTVRTGLDALGEMQDGFLSIVGEDVSVSGTVDTETDQKAMIAALPPDWTTEITVLNPSPPGDVTITLTPDGRTQVAGLLPEGMTDEPFLAAFPGVDLTGITRGEAGRAENWNAPLEGLAIVMPRLEDARVQITGKSLTVKGALKRGYSAVGATASLKTVLDRSWTLDVDLAETAPLAEVILSKRDAVVSLTGVLPDGIAPGDAEGVFGPDAVAEGLTGGGEGDADAWRQGLASVKDGLELFSDANGRIASNVVELNGTLRPGYTPNGVQRWLSDRLGTAWDVGLAGTETEPAEGDTRLSLASGEPETFRRGFWLPDVDFPVSAARCRQEIDAVLAAGKITFLTGSADIDQEGRTLLNRLAAVSVRCLDGSVLSLEIGGHTDSVGNDDKNQELSEARASAVVDAMAARGVRPDGMQAKGFGESQPIASNNDSEGRAQNRRITFEWLQSGE